MRQLDVRAREINEPMKLAAAHAIADIIPEDHFVRKLERSIAKRRIDTVANLLELHECNTIRRCGAAPRSAGMMSLAVAKALSIWVEINRLTARVDIEEQGVVC